MSEVKILEKFLAGLIEFLNELIEQFPEEGDLIVARIFLETQIPIIDIVNIFNRHINAEDGMLRKMVNERNENFLLEHNLFDVFGEDKVSHFKHIWISKQMTADMKEVVWSWIDWFIKLGDSYMRIMKNKILTKSF